MTCEICGADILAKAGGFFVCTGCGMQYDRERIREMAAQCHQEPAEVETPMPMAEELQVSLPGIPPKKKNNYGKILTGAGIAAVGLIALLMVLLPLREKTGPAGSASGKFNAVSEADRTVVEKDIEGSWYYEDAEIGWHEEHYFCGGLVASLTWVDGAPEKASNSVGEYEVLDGQIRRRSLDTDYVLYYDYYYEGDELVLSWHVDSGRDAGSSRIYRKISESKVSSTFDPEDSDADITSDNGAENVTNGMRRALNKAESYLKIMAFSRQGLIDQLEFDGFSYSEAAYAVDACGADWYQQAALRARSYLDIMSFSRQGLIDQLEYDGFLYDQAVYGVDKVY